MESAGDPQLDFAANVDRSVLPLILSLAHEHDLPVCFVRVLRRPVDGQPPPEPPALQRYVAALRAYLAAHGAGFLDDRDDPSLARLPYADGDHVSRDALVAYTDRFWDRIRTPAP
jgi:hypothetical protein